MKQTMKSYPSLDNLEGKTVEELLALRQEIRELRDRQRVAINEEQNATQSEIRREAINERRIFDIQLNELKRQMDELSPNLGAPSQRLKAADLRDKMSELKYQFNIKQEERETRLGRSATERMRQMAKSQLDYENFEICICKAIRDKNGFEEYGFHNQEVKSAENNGKEATE